MHAAWRTAAPRMAAPSDDLPTPPAKKTPAKKVVKKAPAKAPGTSFEQKVKDAFEPAGFKVKTQDEFFKDHVPQSDPDSPPYQPPKAPQHFHPDFVQHMGEDDGSKSYQDSRWADYHQSDDDAAWWHNNFANNQKYQGKTPVSPVLDHNFVQWMNEQNHDSPASWEDYHSSPSTPAEYHQLYLDHVNDGWKPPQDPDDDDVSAIEDLLQPDPWGQAEAADHPWAHEQPSWMSNYPHPEHQQALKDWMAQQSPEDLKAWSEAPKFTPTANRGQLSFEDYLDSNQIPMGLANGHPYNSYNEPMDNPSVQLSPVGSNPHLQKFLETADSDNWFGGENGYDWKKESDAIHSPEFATWFAEKYPDGVDDDGDPVDQYPDTVAQVFLQEKNKGSPSPNTSTWTTSRPSVMVWKTMSTPTILPSRRGCPPCRRRRPPGSPAATAMPTWATTRS